MSFLWDYSSPVCLLNQEKFYDFIWPSTNGGLRKKIAFVALASAPLSRSLQISDLSPEARGWRECCYLTLAFSFCALEAVPVKTRHPDWRGTTGWVLCHNACALSKRVCVSVVIPILLWNMQAGLYTPPEMSMQLANARQRYNSITCYWKYQYLQQRWALVELYCCSHACQPCWSAWLYEL